MGFKKSSISFYLFVFVFLGGSMISISSSDWIGVWAGLEINLFGVIPFFSGMGLAKEMEAVVKYYVVQSVGSLFLLLGSILNYFYLGLMFVNYGVMSNIWCIMLTSGLMLKMGLVPFHFWIPSVMEGLSWVSCMVLSLWQKLVPLIVLGSYVSVEFSKVLVIVGCLGSLVGGIGGFLQTQLRILLGYSSINHSGWLMVGSMYSSISCMCYFIIYFIVSSLLFYLLSLMELSGFSSMVKGFSVFDIKFLVIMIILLVSLAGLPPTIGFAMKWAIIIGLLPSYFMVVLVLVMGSLMSLYYYLCVAFSWCVFSFSGIWLFSTRVLMSFRFLLMVSLVISVVLGCSMFMVVSMFCV